MHHVAIVPEAIPFLLVDGVLIEFDVLVEAALHGIVALRQRPDAEGTLLVKILWCGKQPCIGGQPACVGSHLSLAAIGCLREEPHHTGASDAIGRAQALLHILIAGAQTMGHGVVMAEVHRLRLRTPQPQGQLGLIGACLAHFYGRGIRLPEILQRHAQTALGVAHESISGRTHTRQRTQPWTLRGSPLADGERVVGKLGEPITVPLCPVGEHRTGPGRDVVGTDMAASHLQCPQARAVAAGLEHLYGFGPYASVSGGKCHVPVVCGLSHRHFQPYAQRGDHIALLVAVVDEGMHHAHLFAASVEIKPYHKRQPIAVG